MESDQLYISDPAAHPIYLLKSIFKYLILWFLLLSSASSLVDFFFFFKILVSLCEYCGFFIDT